MKITNCPVCYGPLETRNTTPCYICGAWSDTDERLAGSKPFGRYTLPRAHELILCESCILEEFMVPGGLSHLLRLPPARLASDHLTGWPAPIEPAIALDKFCPTCNLRLAFLRIVADRQGEMDATKELDK